MECSSACLFCQSERSDVDASPNFAGRNANLLRRKQCVTFITVSPDTLRARTLSRKFVMQFNPVEYQLNNSLLLLSTSSSTILSMCDDSVRVVRHDINQTFGIVNCRSTCWPCLGTIKRKGDVRNRFVRCAVVRGTSFTDLHTPCGRC
jgi:hypothetical protein